MSFAVAVERGAVTFCCVPPQLGPLAPDGALVASVEGALHAQRFELGAIGLHVESSWVVGSEDGEGSEASPQQRVVAETGPLHAVDLELSPSSLKLVACESDTPRGLNIAVGSSKSSGLLLELSPQDPCRVDWVLCANSVASRVAWFGDAGGELWAYSDLSRAATDAVAEGAAEAAAEAAAAEAAAKAKAETAPAATASTAHDAAGATGQVASAAGSRGGDASGRTMPTRLPSQQKHRLKSVRLCFTLADPQQRDIFALVGRAFAVGTVRSPAVEKNIDAPSDPSEGGIDEGGGVEMWNLPWKGAGALQVGLLDEVGAETKWSSCGIDKLIPIRLRASLPK